MIIPNSILERIALAHSIATEIIDAVTAPAPGCDVLFCGSSLDPEKQCPNDLDLAVVSTTEEDHLSAVANLKDAFPDARIDIGKDYTDDKTIPRNSIHLWLLRRKEVTESSRIQHTLLSGRKFDKNSGNWISATL